MILKLIVDDQLYELNVPQEFLDQAQEFFARMDSDMDAGWQMSRDWVAEPDLEQRAQIAANKLYTALENDDHNLGRLMAGYILSRVPDLDCVELNAASEVQDIVIRRSGGSPAPAAQAAAAAPPPQAPPATPATAGAMPRGLDKMAAMSQAGRDVSQVFRSGKQWKFSMFNHATGQWEESPAIADKTEAEAMRDFAFKKRYEELCRPA